MGCTHIARYTNIESRFLQGVSWKSHCVTHNIATSDIVVTKDVGPSLRPERQDGCVYHFLRKTKRKIHSMPLALTLTVTLSRNHLTMRNFGWPYTLSMPALCMCHTTLCMHSKHNYEGMRLLCLHLAKTTFAHREFLDCMVVVEIYQECSQRGLLKILANVTKEKASQLTPIW